MKRSILAICFGMAFAASAFADSTVSPYLKVGAKGTVIKSETEIKSETTPSTDSEETSDKSSNKYDTTIMPMVGVGIKSIDENFGVEVSADYAWKKEGDENVSTYAYTAPKVMFLGYLFPQKATSLYAGIGTSWSGVEIEESTFHGLFGNASVGAEFNPSDKVKGIFEVTCDVPAIAASSTGDRPYPLVSLRMGLGF